MLAEAKRTITFWGPASAYWVTDALGSLYVVNDMQVIYTEDDPEAKRIERGRADVAGVETEEEAKARWAKEDLNDDG